MMELVDSDVAERPDGGGFLSVDQDLRALFLSADPAVFEVLEHSAVVDFELALDGFGRHKDIAPRQPSRYACRVSTVASSPGLSPPPRVRVPTFVCFALPATEAGSHCLS